MMYRYVCEQCNGGWELCSMRFVMRVTKVDFILNESKEFILMSDICWVNSDYFAQYIRQNCIYFINLKLILVIKEHRAIGYTISHRRF